MGCTIHEKMILEVHYGMELFIVLLLYVFFSLPIIVPYLQQLMAYSCKVVQQVVSIFKPRTGSFNVLVIIGNVTALYFVHS